MEKYRDGPLIFSGGLLSLYVRAYAIRDVQLQNFEKYNIVHILFVNRILECNAPIAHEKFRE